MKNLLLFLGMAGAILLFAPFISTAATTNTLLSQDFSGGSFPPAGWSANLVEPKGTYMYGSTQGYWYRSTYGNGSANGSAVCWNMYTNGPSGSTSTLTTPILDASAYATSADSTFVDFDLWAPYNYYSHTYGSFTLTLKAGSTTLTTIKNPNSWTFQDGSNYYGFSDPSSNGYYTSNHWVHYHVYIPAGARTSATQVQFQLVLSNRTYFYNYADNMALDNIVVSNTHYNVLTLGGPSTINFGTVPALQTSGPYYTHVSNGTAIPISLTGNSITGANAGDFAVTYFPSTIQPGSSDSIGIIYTPQNGGARSATLNVTTDADIPRTFAIGLSGIGLVPNVSYSAASLFRGVQTELDSASSSQYLYVRSTGGIPLLVNSVSIIGLDSVAYGITSSPSGPIPAGQTDSIGVQFLPDIEGIPDARLVINSNAVNNPADTVELYGIGILPHLMLTPVTLSSQVSNLNHTLVVNFDSVYLGTDSCMQVQLSNPGSDTLAIEKNYLSSKDFDFTLTPLTGAGDTLIPPGGSELMQVCFQPLQRGYRTATVVLKTNIPHTIPQNRTQTQQDTSNFAIQFIGTGVPSGALLITGPSTTDTELIGKQGCVTDTLWNTGGADLTVTALTTSGANAADFNGTYGTFPITIPANSFKTISVCGTPIDTGIANALLTGTGTSGNSGVTATLPLQVYGTRSSDTVFVLTPFGNTCVGSSDTATVVVVTTGNIPSSYAVNTASGTNPSDFVVLQPQNSPLEKGGDTASFQVVFTPTTNANESTNFNVVGGPGGTIPLNVTGSAAAIAGTAADTAAVGTVDTFTLALANNGTCDWTPGTVSVNAPFSYLSGGSTNIPAGSIGDLVFTFSPTADGTFTSPVTFTNSIGVSIPAANASVTGIAAEADVQQVSQLNGFSLGQSHPNPIGVGSEGAVEITVPSPAEIHLAIIDVKGEVVQTVLDRHFDVGTYSVTLDAAPLSSGTYYYQMTAPGGIVLTRQMTVVK